VSGEGSKAYVRMGLQTESHLVSTCALLLWVDGGERLSVYGVKGLGIMVAIVFP
jgi:hypothetical protein